MARTTPQSRISPIKQQATPHMSMLLRARRLPLLAPVLRLVPASARNASASAQPHDRPVAATHVTAPVFAGLLRKTGLSNKKLHALDALAQQDRRAGHDAFPLAVALSGGADSMALTLLLQDHLKRQHIQTPLLAITVDHGLRPESAQEAHDVGQMVTTNWDVEHVIAQCEWADSSDVSEPSLDDTTDRAASKPAKPRSSKLQEEARRHRYALLERVCLEKHVQFLFVAHNLGDQLETMLFRLGRASGINGLAGIASVAPLVTESTTSSDSHDASVTLVRPLLSIRKAQLKATCVRFGQTWVEDPSNDKLVFDRIRIRKVPSSSASSLRPSSVLACALCSLVSCMTLAWDGSPRSSSAWKRARTDPSCFSSSLTCSSTLCAPSERLSGSVRRLALSAGSDDYRETHHSLCACRAADAPAVRRVARARARRAQHGALLRRCDV